MKPSPRKSTPSKPKTTRPRKTSSDTPDITPIRTATCPTLKGTSTLTYQLGKTKEDKLMLRITKSTGSGHFSDEWVSSTMMELLLKPHTQIAAFHLRKVFSGKSANNTGFLAAVLLNEGVLEPHPERRRYYQLTGNSLSPTPPTVVRRPPEPKPPAKSKPRTPKPSAVKKAPRK